MRSLITLREMEQKECLLSLEIFFARLSKCILFVALPAPTLMSAVHLSKEDTTEERGPPRMNSP